MKSRKMRTKDSDSHLFRELVISLVGTVIGIILTVGVTYWSEQRDKEEMARKVMLLTIHNLDVSIGSMERLVDELSRQDTIFHYVRERATSSVSPDTLDLFVSALYSHHIRPIDSSTEAIFSSNFEIWKYIDDPKIIGRIANCYSLMDECGEEYERIERNKYQNFLSVYDAQDKSVRQSGKEMTDVLLSQNKVLSVMDALPYEISLLRSLIENAKALNDRNKTELRVNQKELDEIGNSPRYKTGKTGIKLNASK